MGIESTMDDNVDMGMLSAADKLDRSLAGCMFLIVCHHVPSSSQTLVVTRDGIRVYTRIRELAHRSTYPSHVIHISYDIRSLSFRYTISRSCVLIFGEGRFVRE
jgi:hypothetical protein